VVRLGEEVGDLAARRVSFSGTESGGDYELQGSSIVSDGSMVLNLYTTRLRGVHNAENVMAAVAAVEALGVSREAASEALAGYAPPLHRCELIRTLDGVEYINDSKATNLHALEAALLSQDRPTILIAGGKEKGLDYEPLLPHLEKSVETAVVFGEIRDRLAAIFSQAVTTRVAESLEEAVGIARNAAPHGSTILFSPGTSSFDMFSGYEERGDTFRATVQALR
jgi:UDP-N-acetylmuramoylalanine--D-glutamate ligase